MTNKQRKMIKKRWDIDIPKHLLATAWVVDDIGKEEEKVGAVEGDLCVAVYNQSSQYIPEEFKGKVKGSKGTIYYFFERKYYGAFT